MESFSVIILACIVMYANGNLSPPFYTLEGTNSEAITFACNNTIVINRKNFSGNVEEHIRTEDFAMPVDNAGFSITKKEVTVNGITFTTTGRTDTTSGKKDLIMNILSYNSSYNGIYSGLCNGIKTSYPLLSYYVNPLRTYSPNATEYRLHSRFPNGTTLYRIFLKIGRPARPMNITCRDLLSSSVTTLQQFGEILTNESDAYSVMYKIGVIVSRPARFLICDFNVKLFRFRKTLSDIEVMPDPFSDV